MKLVFFRATGPYLESSKAAWNCLFQWLNVRGHHVRRGRGYGLFHNDPRTYPAGLLRYDACVRIPPTWSEVDNSLVQIREFAGGSYAVRQCIGPYAALGSVVSEIRDVWIPREGIYADPTRPMLTIYHDDPRTTELDVQTADVCVPVSVERRTPDRI